MSTKKIYQKPYITVIALKSADVINTSNERYEEEDTDDWFNSPNNP